LGWAGWGLTGSSPPSSSSSWFSLCFSSGDRGTAVRTLRRFPELSLVVLGFGLNAVWEFLQSPLYADHGRDLEYLLRSRLHCAGGDTLILLFAFGVTSLASRSRQWLRDGRPWPTVLFVALGFAYTVWSEWFNTQVAFSWQYAESMPRILGIGVAPLAQWLTIPFLLALILRKPRS
jgi:hypothetical protein